MIFFCVKFEKDPLYRVKLKFLAPWLPWQRPPFWIFFQPPKAATHYGGYSYKVSWSLMNGIQFIFKSPFLVYPTDSDFFFGLISFYGNGSHSEKVNPWQHNFTWHMIFLQGFITKVWSRHLREIEQTKMCGRIIIIRRTRIAIAKQ